MNVDNINKGATHHEQLEVTLLPIRSYVSAILTNEKGLSPDDERPKNCFQLYYSVINVVILRGGSCRLPDVTPTGFNVSPETSEVRYMCH